MAQLPDDPLPWKVLSSQYLYKRFWHTVRVERVELPTGAIIPEYYITEYRPWVNVVAVTAADEVLLIRQYRHGLGQVHYEIPAGTTDPGETALEDAARRELREETGYGGGRWSPLMVLSANPALQNNLAHTFLAEGVERQGAPKTEPGEDLRLHPVAFPEVRRLLDAGEIVQALHAAPLAKYLLMRADAARGAR